MNTHKAERKKIYYIDNTKNITVKSTSETENCTKRDYRLHWLEKWLYVKESGFKYKRAAK